jgi:hypothetical protein
MNDPKTRRRLFALALLVLLPLAWLLWPDGRMATAKAARAALADPKLTPDQRREKGKALQQAMRALTPAQREALMAADRKRRAAEVAGYFRLSPKEKARFLDERINKMTAATRGKGPSGAAPAAGKGPAGVASAGGKGLAGGAPGGTQGGPQGKSGGPPTVASRDGRRQDRLDGTNPAERAMFTQFFQDLEARRRQRGLPAMGGRPPRG